MSHAMSHDARLRTEIRSYYDIVSRYIEKELLHRHDRDFWLGVLEETSTTTGSSPSVLELGCGTGRVTGILASGSPSPRVVAIDLSREMLRRARERLEKRPGVHLLLADMRSIRLAGGFDLVVAANDPFIHLVEERDRDRAMETVARHLADGAGDVGSRFVLEAFWLGEDRLERAAEPGGYERERTVEDGGDGGDDGEPLRIRERWSCRPGSRTCSVRYEYLRDGRPADRADFRARLWSPDELCAKLEKVGLRVRSLWGGFDRRPFDPGTASHLIVMAGPS